MTRRTSRREFLRGAPDEAAERGGRSRCRRGQSHFCGVLPQKSGQSPPAAATRQAQEPYLLHISRRAMACQFEVFFNAGQYAGAAQAAVEALDLVNTLEDEFSYFRPASRLSRLNLVAADGPVEVDPRLFALLELALELHRETAGAFDITSAPLWEAWGFARREGSIPSAGSLAEAMQLVGSGYVKLDARQRTVHFTKPGVRLNLGSIGKGYALDRAAEVLVSAGVGDFLFHAGQSSVLARGSRGEADDAAAGRVSPGWSVGIRDPLRPKRRLAEIRLRDRALGTSGSTMQYFRSRGRRYAHILDPRTGQPAEGVLSVTVAAPTAALADGLSTAMFVMGPELARDYCASRPELAALLVCPAGASGRAEIHAIGFGEDELTLLDDQ